MSGASRLLINESPLQVLPSLAGAIGLNEAIVLQQIHYWIKDSEKGGRNFHEGYHWVFNSIRGWHEQLPFWSENTVQRIFATLEDRGLIISGNYNQTAFDRTKWYRIDYAKVEALLEGKTPESISPSCEDPRPQDGVMEDPKMVEPIPETTIDYQRLTINSPEQNMPNGLLGAIQKLPYWGPEPTDAQWLEEFTQDYPELSLEAVKECRDYWDGRRAGSKGAWKHRLRNWCKKRKEFASAKGKGRGLPEAYTPTRDYPDL